MLAGHAACRRGRGVPLLLAPLDIGLCLGFLPEGRLVCVFLVCALLPVLALLRHRLLLRPRRRRGVRGRRGRRRGTANHGQSGGYASSSLSMTVKTSPGCLPGGMVTSIRSPLGGRTKIVCAEEAVVSGIAKV